MIEPTTILYTLDCGTHVVHEYECTRRDGSRYTKYEAWRPGRGFFMLGIGSERVHEGKIVTNRPAGDERKYTGGVWHRKDFRGDWIPLGPAPLSRGYKGGGQL